MKFAVLFLSLISSSMIVFALLFGTLANNFVEESQKTNLENYCEQLKTWHPDCKIE